MVSNEPGTHAPTPLVGADFVVELGERLADRLEEALSRYDKADETHLNGVHKTCSSLAHTIDWVFSSGHIDLGSLGFDILLELQEVALVGSRRAEENLHLHQSHISRRSPLGLALIRPLNFQLSTLSVIDYLDAA